MKKILLSILAVGMFASCGSQKQIQQVAQNPGYQRTAIEIPCAENGFDDADYYRGTGTATAVNQQNARRTALQNAKAMVREKLGGFVQGLSTDYSRNVAGEAQAAKVQSIIEGEFATLVEKELNDAQQTCEKGFVLQDGLFEYWVAIQIPKQQLIENLTSQLSRNEELEIEFNREEFRKFAEDKMKRMQAAQGK
ncbi:MAG: hypothetical protein IKV22_00900 [Paludibacteraceae bacterium]|nr:hypothetical protein [Paludibacteraceae bacterium]